MIWKAIKGLSFHFVQVTEPFSVITNLSHLTLQHKNVGKTFLEVMVDFNEDLLTKGSVDDTVVNNALNPLLRTLKDKSIRLDNDEESIEYPHEYVDKIFQYIASSITLEPRIHHNWVDSMFEDNDKVVCGNLGMGCNESTWYGTVDGRLRGQDPDGGSTSLIAVRDEVESDGSSMVFEIKRKSRHLSRAIGSVVLSSFVEHNLHKDLNSLVPLFLLNSQSLQILMYDCKADVLLISDKFFFRENYEVNKGFILLLFIFINHRYVVKCKLAVYRLNMFKLIMHIST